jgi:hypothetical protein
MPDLHDFLDAEARRVRSQPAALGAVLERATRRRRSKRVATAVLALALAAAGIGITYAAFDPRRTLRPGGGPVPGPSPSVTPAGRSIPGLVLSNDSTTQGAAEFAAALLTGEGVTPAPDFVAARGGSSEVTAIHCHPNREAQALWLRDRFFPGAEIRPRIEPDTILIRIGDDFVTRNRDLFELFMTVRSFMTRRAEGSGAEAFLSANAADRFADEESGVSLYAYVRGGAFLIRSFIPRGEGAALVDVEILTPEGGDAVASERLTVGDQDPSDGHLEILDAEQTSPPDPMFEQIRIFVRQFLRARRQASGAGTFLGPDAREAYASHERGLDLLGYAASDQLIGTHIAGLDKLDPERSLVQVRFALQGRDVLEALTVERLGQTILVIADAERVGG